MAEPKQFVVTGKYVTVKTQTVEGMRVVGLNEGAPVPADISPEQRDHLLSHGLIAVVGAEPVPAADMSAAEKARYTDGLVTALEEQQAKVAQQLADARAAQEAARESAGTADPNADFEANKQAAADRLAKESADNAASQNSGGSAGDGGDSGSTGAGDGSGDSQPPATPGSGTASKPDRQPKPGGPPKPAAPASGTKKPSAGA